MSEEMESMDPNVALKWSDTPAANYREAVIQVLMFIDEEAEGKGWDQPPMLGVVHGSRLANYGTMSVTTPHLPDEAFEDFERAVALLAAEAFSAEITDDESKQRFLNTGVQASLQGWLFSAEFYSKQVDDQGNEVTGVELENRMTIMVDVDGEKYGVVHVRGEPKAHEMTEVPEIVLTRSLSLLVGASVMSIVRRNLDKSE